MSNKVVMVSFIDSSNIGDQLISKMLDRELLSECEVRNFSYRYIADDYYSGGEVKRHGKRNSFYNKYVKKIKPVHALVSRLKWFNNYNKLKKQDSLALRGALRETGTLVIGGGNVIFDSSKYTYSARKFAHLLNIANKEGANVFVSSIGIGPFQTELQEKEAVEQLKRCSAVTVRDERSKAYCDKYGLETVVKSVDPVFLLPEEKKISTLNSKHIGICVIDYRIAGVSYLEYKAYKQHLVELINQLHMIENAQITLFSTEKEDYNTIDELKKELLDSAFVSYQTVNNSEELLSLYATFDMLIGTRMHAMIIAASQCIPIVGLSWQQKVDEMFKNMALSDRCYGIPTLNDNQQEIVAAVTAILDNKEQYIEEASIIKQKLTAEFELVKQEFNKLIVEKR